MKKVKIILVDDHELVLDGIAAMLENIDYIEIIGKALSGEEAINLCDEKRPDIVLMDIVMSGMDGIESTRWITGYNKQIKVILLSSEVNENYVTEAIKAGAQGYLPKNVKKAVLVEALLQVSKGEKYFTQHVTRIILDTYQRRNSSTEQNTSNQLTKREKEILNHVAAGKKNQEVADDLAISIRTVEVHKTNILSKLDLKNSTDLVLYAIKNKLVEF